MDISLLSRASLRPPTHHSDGGDLASAPPPSSVLLDVSAYILNKRNSTTATCTFRNDNKLQVTFFPAHPPRVSYFCVFCPGMKNCDYSVEPKIIATEGNLVLFRAAFGSLYEIWDSSSYEYFIYRANGGSPDGSPLLEQIPQPHGVLIPDRQIGLLSDSHGGYTIVALLGDSSARNRTSDRSCLNQYKFCIFSSKDKFWTMEDVKLTPQEYEFHHVTSKVITIGGETGTMAFVDLWCGILLYDVLDGGAGDYCH
ncbi:hypothetical protein QOZ80_1BG0072070 [Eleusine coracana subsp. coracana]|nr:hypothetical protein QOZ80_1BG0072070 [Eleusine coracana subsp. coracana]